MGSLLASIGPATGSFGAPATEMSGTASRSADSQSGFQEFIAGVVARGAATGFDRNAVSVVNVLVNIARDGVRDAAGTLAHDRLGEMATRIDSAVSEANTENWDEYGALPASKAAADHARRLGRILVALGPLPRAAVDPDGDVGLRWYRDALHRLAVSVSPEGRVAYAARLGNDRVQGTEHLRSGAASTLSELLTRLYADIRKAPSQSHR